MPKKPQKETDAEQSERFRKDAQKLIDAGDLNLIESELALEKLIMTSKKTRVMRPDAKDV
jgi:hypothetical protein